MNQPRQERRRHERYSPDGILVRLISADYDEKLAPANFANRLLNLGMKGMCVETTGRLRSDLNMIAEVRFNDLAATLRAETRIVWADTKVEGQNEIYTAGLEFVGNVQIAKPIREYLQGGDREMIQSKREMEYAELKRNAESRKAGGRRKGKALKRLMSTAFILAVLYAGSFWGLVLFGRSAPTGTEISYRYLSDGGAVEGALAKFYYPAYWLFRKVGVDLRYEPGAE